MKVHSLWWTLNVFVVRGPCLSEVRGPWAMVEGSRTVQVRGSGFEVRRTVNVWPRVQGPWAMVKGSPTVQVRGSGFGGSMTGEPLVRGFKVHGPWAWVRGQSRFGVQGSRFD